MVIAKSLIWHGVEMVGFSCGFLLFYFREIEHERGRGAERERRERERERERANLKQVPHSAQSPVQDLIP